MLISILDVFKQTISEFAGVNYAAIIAGLAALVGIAGAIIWGKRFNASFEKANHIHKASFYSELDRIYFDLLKMAIEHPHLRRVEPIPKGKDRVLNAKYDPYPNDPSDTEEERAAKGEKGAQYDAYAFMVWNFVETLHDRCQDYGELLGTWATIVAAENDLHRGWFLQQMALEHQRCTHSDYEPCEKFCKPFQVFIYEKNFLPVNGSYPNWSFEGRGEFKASPVFADTRDHTIAEPRGKNEVKPRRENSEASDRSIPL